jgi:indolepyruvate ferredoxin oxidoreductase
MVVEPRFLTSQGPEIFTGNELLLKGALETEGGVHLLGGYPGSPISAFFDSLVMIKDLLISKGIHAVMNNNEALAAAMLNGLQTLPARGMIVMKSVGVHVAADALALSNLAGAHPEGGAVVVYGDDPWSDSTQVPADSRFISRHLFIPVIEPSDPQEIKDYVDLAFKLSRQSRLFAGFVLTTNLADGGGSVQCRPNQYPRHNVLEKFSLETARIPLDHRVLLPPRTWWQEAALNDRFRQAIQAARQLGLNRLEHPARARRPLGFITSGLAYGYLVQVLLEIGLLGEFPILKLGLTYPVDEQAVTELAGQCERIVVVEERRGFIEEQVNEIILKERQYGRPAGRVEVWGKRFPQDLPGLPDTRGLHPSIITSRLAPLIKLACTTLPVRVPAGLEAMDREMRTIDATAVGEISALPARTPTFCPGCPHRDSASLCLEVKKRFMDPQYMRRVHGREVVDLLFHGDTGCYTMLMFPPTSPLMHDYSGMGLGGGTGAGTDPFVPNKEAVFMGDGTFFHSGQLAISQAVKFGQDITFVILDNSTTGMTGHQPTPGVDYDVIGQPTAVQDIEEIVSGMAGEGNLTVMRVDPEKRGQYAQVLERTFLADGVKVIIATKECGITRGRRQRRQEREMVRRLGYLPRWTHMNTNPDVCRYCLACTEMTGCPGLAVVQTDYGPKIGTDLTSCINDGACERVGACSSFEQVTIRRRRPPRSPLPELGLDDIPEPRKRPPGDLWRCCLVGVGGMGIGLATQILVRAAHKEGYPVLFLDKKGLAIRNGGVTSQVVFNISRQPITAVIPFGKADLLVGLDVLEAARALDPAGRTRIASPEHTAAVINTHKIPTILSLMGREDFDPSQLESLIRSQTRAEDTLARDLSRLCEKYLGSKLFANTMMLGFAFQKGLIPVSMHSMAWAVKDTIKADFRKNLYAFNMGRKLVIEPDLFRGPVRRTGWRDVLEDKCRNTIRRYLRGQRLAGQLRQLAAETVEALGDVDDDLRTAVVVRLYDCMRWGGIGYARRYAEALGRIRQRDNQQCSYAATRAVVHNLASAMLIKDPIFLAELITSPEKYARDREKYDVHRADGDRIVYRHLMHLPLRVRGRQVDVRLVMRPWALKLLKRMRRLRRFLPGQGPRREFLRRYLALVDQFNFATAEEYQQQVAALSSPPCMDCLNPTCREIGCPLESSVPEWVALAQAHQWDQASRLLHEHNNFPEFTASICPAPCQEACKQGRGGFAVQIRHLEQQVVEQARESLAPQAAAPKTGKKVAVIGSGPAGLAAAQQLARAGHEVTVFEKDAAPGGLLRYGIPGYRLDKALIDRRIEQMKAEGVRFICRMGVGSDIPAHALRRQFDAALLASGAVQPRDLEVPGRGLQGIHFALDFLRAAPREGDGGLGVRGKTVAVIGGGLTGEDCVETALRQGARKIYQFEILPAGANQQAAHPPDPAVQRYWSVATKAFAGSGGRLAEVRAARVRWHSSSRGPIMKELPESEFGVRAEVALLAMGYEPVVEAEMARQLGLELDPRGRCVCRDHATSAGGVFVAGDLAGEKAIVAAAIASGRRAARRIEDYLKAHEG